MWIVTNKGFLSAVAHRDKPDEIVLRARNIEALEGYFDKDEIIEMRKSDYRFRVFIKRERYDELLLQLSKEIDYPNFKDSIQDSRVKKMASKIWAQAMRFQNIMEFGEDDFSYDRSFPDAHYGLEPYYGPIEDDFVRGGDTLLDAEAISRYLEKE